MLIRLEINNNKIINEEIILQGCKKHNKPCYKIGRIRDIEIDKRGNIFIISDDKDSSLWKIFRKK